LVLLQICGNHFTLVLLLFVARSKRQLTNPFYVVLMVVGVAFALTACAYGWSARLKLDAETFDRNADFIALVDRYGMLSMIVELALLTVLTFLAIGTDEFWERRAQHAGGIDEPPS
jgi:formate hydrogenlyase subunit 3/multisubunit Na+/H+ antiporter MnhD subunit